MFGPCPLDRVAAVRTGRLVQRCLSSTLQQPHMAFQYPPPYAAQRSSLRPPLCSSPPPLQRCSPCVPHCGGSEGHLTLTLHPAAAPDVPPAPLTLCSLFWRQRRASAARRRTVCPPPRSCCSEPGILWHGLLPALQRACLSSAHHAAHRRCAPSVPFAFLYCCFPGRDGRQRLSEDTLLCSR